VNGHGRTKEELVLLAVSVVAAAVAAGAALRASPASPLVWTATALALALALATAFAFWFTGAVRRVLRRDAAAVRELLSALPEGLAVVEGDVLVSVNRRLCDLLGYDRDELVGASAPFPFWPPERRHELERWHAGLGDGATSPSTLVLLHADGRRLPVLVARGTVDGESDRHVLTVRDVSVSHRRGRRLLELSTREPVTGLLNERGLEEHLGRAVGRALAGEHDVSVALLDLGIDLDRPEGLLVVEEVRKLVRVGEDLGRTQDDELAWILPETSADDAIRAVERVRRALAGEATVTAGVCDLASAGCALSLYAFAGRALATARMELPGGTSVHRVREPARRVAPSDTGAEAA
jgi:PAS domain S-box-containing protein